MDNLETAQTGMSPPDVNEVRRAFATTVGEMGAYCQQIDRNADTRFCIWNGQTPDGRKHGGWNTPAFPFEGASDLRVFVADDCVEGNVATLVNALRDSRVIATPTEGGDISRAKTVSTFMQWMRERMTELEREAEILANFQQEKGVGVAHVFWSRKYAMRRVKMDIADFYKQYPMFVDLIAAAAVSEDSAQVAAEELSLLFPDSSQATIRRAIKALIRGEDVVFTQKTIVEDRPRIKAYAVGLNLFLPMGTDDLQAAPYIFKVDAYTPQQLRSFVQTNGWNADWVERAVKQAGVESVPEEARENERFQAMAQNAAHNNLVQVVSAYIRTVDDDGVESIMYAVFLPVGNGGFDGKSEYAICETIDSDPVKYPFVVFARESLSRRILEARGIPEITKHVQTEVKLQRDSRVDRTSLTTMPPLLVRSGVLRGTSTLPWGPGKQIPLQRLDDVRWADTPKSDNGSIEIENTLLSEVRRRFGGLAANDAQARDAIAREKKMVMSWLGGWREVFRMIWDLHRLYGHNEEVFRVAGNVSDLPESLTRQDAETAYDFNVTLSGLDPDDVTERLKAFAEIASKFDRNNRVDWGEFCAIALGNIDQSLTTRLLRPQQAATDAEIADTRNDLAQMWAGMDIDVPQNANPDLRLRILGEYLRGSDAIPARDVDLRMQNDPVFAARIQKYAKQLEFIKQQRQNAVTGVLGTPPGNMTPLPIEA